MYVCVCVCVFNSALALIRCFSHRLQIDRDRRAVLYQSEIDHSVSCSTLHTYTHPTSSDVDIYIYCVNSHITVRVL